MAAFDCQTLIYTISEMESFLNDLAGASLSAEHEKRRVTLEQKLSAVRQFTPSTPSLLPKDNVQTYEKQKEQEEDTRVYSVDSLPRPRSWSCPALNECIAAQDDTEIPEVDGSKDNMTYHEISGSKTERTISNENDETQNEELRNKKKFERLRQAYLETLKVPRRRTASEPQVRNTSSSHRVPNPEYIHGINTGTAFTFETRRDTELSRKPNRKGFNVVWDVPTADVCG